MADTAPKVPAEERQEAPEAVDKKAEALARLIKKSKHLVVFTGAGISTSAGIPDFRGPEGIWTLRAQGRQRTSPVDTLQAVPTATHMALVGLQRRGFLKYLISQNCDGLHRKSGILPDRISEVHGNSNREYCKDCGKEYLRDFRAVASYEKTVHDHRTGRKCTRCGGVLLDSIVNFGEALPAEPLQLARDHAKKADLFLVLGSSLTVSPANELPEAAGRKKNANLAICNLQDTPLDGLADMRIHSKADELMVRVMAKLDIPIPSFILHRRLVVQMETAGNDRQQLRVYGVDVDGTPITFLRSVKLEYNRRMARSEPFIINFRSDLDPGTELKLELEFMGHYGEPNLGIVYEYSGDDDNAQALYLLEYNPQNGEWKVTKQAGSIVGNGASSDMRIERDANPVPMEVDDLPNDSRPTSTANSFPEVIVID